MPSVREAVTTTSEQLVMVGKDKDGAELRIGDSVTVELRITGIREVLDPETAEHATDHLELSIVKPNGYHAHMCVWDSAICKKV